MDFPGASRGAWRHNPKILERLLTPSLCAVVASTLTILGSGCGTLVRRETVRRKDGQEVRRVEYVSGERYAAEKRISRPRWHGLATSFKGEDREPQGRSPEPAASVRTPTVYESSAPVTWPAVATATTGYAQLDSSSVPIVGLSIARADGPSLPWGGFELRYSRSRLWTALETNFQSPNFTSLAWNRRPITSGWGPEAAIFFDDGASVLGLRIGTFRGSVETNSHREGGLYLKETTRTEAYWADAEVRGEFNEWLFVTLAVGGFLYHVETDLDTNAPSFVYDTASADGAFGALGLGGGLETPWSFPLHLFAAANFWLPYAHPDASFEWGLGQVSAGVSWRY